MQGPGIAAAVTWAREVWLRRDDISSMRLAWQYARGEMAIAKRQWARVRGPATATWATLTRIGWTFSSPAKFITDEGIVLDLLDFSPLKTKK